MTMTADEVKSQLPKEFEFTIEPEDVQGAIRGESDACVLSNAIERTLHLHHDVKAWVDKPYDVTLEIDEEGKCPVTICTYAFDESANYIVRNFDATGDVIVGSKLKASRED